MIFMGAKGGGALLVKIPFLKFLEITTATVPSTRGPRKKIITTLKTLYLTGNL